MALVVVFPFVAETIATPAGSRARERVDRTGIDLPEQLSGQRRAAAAPGGAREATDQAGGRRFGRQAHSHGLRAYPAAAVVTPLWPTCTFHKMI